VRTGDVLIGERVKTDIVLRFMPHPLPEALTAVLQLDRTAALAAAFIIGTHHADVLQWVARAIRGDAPMLKPSAVRRGRKADGGRKPRANGADPYLSRRLARREADDQAPVAAMRRNTGATIGELATAIGKSRTSIMSAQSSA
jgi:hypothetical protein